MTNDNEKNALTDMELVDAILLKNVAAGADTNTSPESICLCKPFHWDDYCGA